MSLAPLPLIDGCLFMDNSGWLESMQTCYRYLEYKQLHKRIEAGEKAALNFGSAIHLALEHRYKKYKNQFLPIEYYSEVAEIFTKFFNEHPAAADDFRNLNWAMETIRKYNEKYEQEEFQLMTGADGNVLVELPFSLPLFTWQPERREWFKLKCLTQEQRPFFESHDGIPVIYTGRIDLPVIIDEQIYVMDHKTTSMLGEQFFQRMKMSSQQKGYLWAFEQVLGKPVAGYIVNAIRTKMPPLYVTQGTRQGAMTPAKWWNESLQRERYIVPKGTVSEWRQNTISLIDEFFHHYQAGYLPMKTTQCTNFGRCPYYDVCSMIPEDRVTLLMSGLYKDNDWTPLSQPTQAK